MSHKKFGPDRFSRFDVYWIQTDKQTNKHPDKPNLYIDKQFKGLNLLLGNLLKTNRNFFKVNETVNEAKTVNFEIGSNLNRTFKNILRLGLSKL